MEGLFDPLEYLTRRPLGDFDLFFLLLVIVSLIAITDLAV